MTNLEAFQALLSVAEAMAKIQGADFSQEEFKHAREAIDRMAPGNPTVISAAREAYGDDECEIDDDAQVSEGEGGTWVAAWVWVEDEDQ